MKKGLNGRLSPLCRFVTVSGALWMWMSALPYCLPLLYPVAPSSQSAITSWIFALRPSTNLKKIPRHPDFI